MLSRDDAFARHHQERWLRPDAARWVRGDISRYHRPGCDLAKAVPAIGRKYNADQPRVPAGSPDGGQWTNGSANGSDVPQPMGSIDFGDLPNFSDLFALFQIAPQEFDNSDDVQLAGDPPGAGDNNNLPEIPTERPDTSVDRMKVVRDLARLGAEVSRVAPALDVISMATAQAEWLRSYEGAIKSYNDPPKTFEELQNRVSSTSEPGYEDHHIEERSLLRQLGYTWSEVNDPRNVVRIPTLKHYEISAWYGKPNEEFGGLSPRDYLRDKDADERRRVGLFALVKSGVMKP